MRDWLFPVVVVAGIAAAVVYFGGLSKDSGRPRRAAPGPAPVTHPEAALPGQPEEEERPVPVEELRAACIEEIKQRRMPRYDEPTACHRYEDLTRGTLPPARAVAPPPAVSSSAPRNAAPAQESPYAAISVDDCARFRRGGIDYRSCRHREAERIRRECTLKTRRADEATGERRQQLRREAAAYCREQSRYRAVD